MLNNRSNSKLKLMYKEYIIRNHARYTMPELAKIAGVGRQIIRSFCNHHGLKCKPADRHAPKPRKPKPKMGKVFDVDIYMKGNSTL